MKNKKEKQKDFVAKIFKILDDKNTDPLEKLLDLEKKHPKDIGLLQALSHIYQQKGQNTEALKYMNDAYEVDPNNYSTNFNMGNLYKKFKKYDEAIRFYEKSITLNKKLKEGFNAIGDIYFQNKELNKAVDYYKSSFKIDPKKTNITCIIRLAESLLMISVQKKDVKSMQESKYYFEIINKIYPNNYSIITYLININTNLGMKNEAIILENQRDGVIVINRDSKEVIIRN